MTNLADLLLLNLYWLVGCIPIVTIGTSTAALYHCLILRADGCGITPTRDFWRAFRDNFKQSLFLALFAAVCLLALGGYLYLLLIRQNSPLWPNLAFFIIFCLLVLPGLSFLFPMQSRYQNTVLNTVKNAWLLALAHPLTAILVMFLDLLPLIVWLLAPSLFLRIAILWILLGRAATADAASYLLLKMWKKHTNTAGEELP